VLALTWNLNISAPAAGHVTCFRIGACGELYDSTCCVSTGVIASGGAQNRDFLKFSNLCCGASFRAMRMVKGLNRIYFSSSFRKSTFGQHLGNTVLLPKCCLLLTGSQKNDKNDKKYVNKKQHLGNKCCLNVDQT
jgi:hypothetical protein